jgi:hypothetical protein
MKYLYYKLYQFQKWVGTDSQPEIPSFILLSTIQVFYISNLLFLINCFIIPFKLELIHFIGLCILLVVINHFYLYKQRHKILSNYQGESKTKNTLGFIILFVFVAFAFSLTFILIQLFGYWR